MKALFKLFRRFDARRIFGFIRRLGGHVTSKSQVLRFAFYPRPPGRGRPAQNGAMPKPWTNFYPRPPGGGRPSLVPFANKFPKFLSTPSGWRATLKEINTANTAAFLCHALRVEGDDLRRDAQGKHRDFYPRPPGGGRLDLREPTAAPEIFLSTPSGWRATLFAQRETP